MEFSAFGNNLVPSTYNSPGFITDFGAFSYGFNFGGDVKSPIEFPFRFDGLWK